MDRRAKVVEEVRDMGMSLALDDFGDGRSSLRLWSQLKPEFVKIDKYFTKDISRHADMLKTIQALQQIGAIFNTGLVAEGIETLEDLRVLRDLGIPDGQGYLLGLPTDKPVAAIDPKSEGVLKDRRVPVFPESAASAQLADSRAISVIDAPTVDIHTTNCERLSESAQIGRRKYGGVKKSRHENCHFAAGSSAGVSPAKRTLEAA